jgi:hypothetical protein
MSREIMQQALNALKYHTEQTYSFHQTNVAIELLEQELAKPEPIYVMGQYAGEGKVASASFGLPKGAFEFAPYTGAGESAKIKHSLEPKPEQEPVAWIEHEWSGTGVTHLHFDRRKPTLRDEVLNPVWTPLYTAPSRKEWVGLTQAEINRSISNLLENDTDPLMTLAYVIEAKLKEKNT